MVIIEVINEIIRRYYQYFLISLFKYLDNKKILKNRILKDIDNIF